MSQRRAAGPLSASAADAVYLALKNRVLDGSLVPGSRLLEEDLAEEFGVSRTPVREALSRLEAEDLCVQGGRGLIVAQPSQDEVMEIYELRETLGGLAARLAAERATDSDILKMGAILDACGRALREKDVAGSIDLALQFDRALWEASKNKRLVKVLDELQSWQHRSHLSTLLYRGRPEAALREHRHILASVTARDSGRAEETARDHMRQSRDVRIHMDLVEARGSPAPSIALGGGARR